MFCIDASVIISAVSGTEIASESSRAFLEFVKSNRIKVFLPEIAKVEIASGLLRATKKGDIALEFIEILKLIPNFSFVPVDNQLAHRAVQVVSETGLRAADAIYVALALDYRLVLVTLDKEQILKTQKLITAKSPDAIIR